MSFGVTRVGSLVLDVVAWAAVLKAGDTRQLGAAESEDCIPAARRRRLPEFSRNVLRCAIPLLAQQPGKALVFSSVNGDLASTVRLLQDLAVREPLSPALFALSVHNAPSGALSLCVTDPGDQVAVAGDAAALQAGLVDAYARIQAGEAETVLLVFAEDRLDSVYADLDDDSPGVFLAMDLRLASGQGAPAFRVLPHRRGAQALVLALEAGLRRLQFAASFCVASAA